MEKTTSAELFDLLSTASEVTNIELQTAYGCFTEHMRTVSQSEDDLSEVFRTLSVTRVELAFLQSLNRHGVGKKCPEVSLHRQSYPVS
jgi:hypothetical protein